MQSMGDETAFGLLRLHQSFGAIAAVGFIVWGANGHAGAVGIACDQTSAGGAASSLDG